MCGLITIYRTDGKPVKTDRLLDIYRNQCQRGRQGFGFCYLTPKGTIKVYRCEEEFDAFHTLARVRSPIVQFHHRLPTSTENRWWQNHPITAHTDKGLYCLTHNGVIHNAWVVKNKHEEEKVTYVTEDKGKWKFNDSESLLHELVRAVERKEALRTEGSVAFVLMEGDRGGRFRCLRFGRNDSSPLYHVAYEDGHTVLSSQNPDMNGKELAACTVAQDTLYTLRFDFEARQARQFRRPLPIPTYTPPKSYDYRADKGKAEVCVLPAASAKDAARPTAYERTWRRKDWQRASTERRDEWGSKLLCAIGDAELFMRELSALTGDEPSSELLTVLDEIDEHKKDITRYSNLLYGNDSRGARDAKQELDDWRGIILEIMFPDLVDKDKSRAEVDSRLDALKRKARSRPDEPKAPPTITELLVEAEARGSTILRSIHTRGVPPADSATPQAVHSVFRATEATKPTDAQ